MGKAIARGVETGLFAYTTGRPKLGDLGRYECDWARIAFERTVSEDEIDLDSGFLIVPGALPEKAAEVTLPAPGVVEDATSDIGQTAEVRDLREPGDSGDEWQRTVEGGSEFRLSFVADRHKLFGVWPATRQPCRHRGGGLGRGEDHAGEWVR